MYKLFDGMTWPQPGLPLSEVEWRLRHGHAGRSDMLVAASVIAAYTQMIRDPARKRDAVVRELRNVGAPERATDG